MNAYNPIFDGFFDANGNAVQGDATTGKTGTFKGFLAVGQIHLHGQGRFRGFPGIGFAESEKTLITANYGIQIGNLFNNTGTLIAYGYNSKVGKTAVGTYKFGAFASKTVPSSGGPIPGAPAATGLPGGQELLISGGFIVTAANFKLLGDTVNATSQRTDVPERAAMVFVQRQRQMLSMQIGNYHGNFKLHDNTKRLRQRGKPPAQKFSFKSGKGKRDGIFRR